MTEQSKTDKPYRMTDEELSAYKLPNYPHTLREMKRSLADAAQDKMIEMGYKSPEEVKELKDKISSLQMDISTHLYPDFQARLNSPEVREIVATWFEENTDTIHLMNEPQRTYLEDAASLLAKIGEGVK